MTCYACHAGSVSGDVAFLAGVAFVFQFNNEAMRERLCEEHQTTLVRAASGAAKVVPSDAKRGSPT
jgi:hypothetical protein